MATLCPEDLSRLLQSFAAAPFRPKDSGKAAAAIQEKCCQLFKRDTPDAIHVQNTSGELSTSYPLTLIIPRTSHKPTGSSPPGRREPETNPVASGDVDAGKLRDLMRGARVARCRARFPVPVILWDGKYVCRSATLSGGPEIYGRSGFDLLFPTANEDEPADAADPVPDDPSDSQSLSSFSSLSLSDSSRVFSKVRAQDINLLHQLGVKFICDLMVEKKKVKFGVYITSSEKADKEGRYNDFQILSLPYPGCEFFRVYRDKGYAGEGLVFDWSQNFVDAVLDIPTSDPVATSLKNIRWDEYRTWDIIQLTQNYLRLFLRYLICSNSSLLVHCISGWDRTPLFVSLLRLALWADGKIHQDLSALEITFLTVAYDWYLFGHNLNDRLQKGEEILFFCFYFLQFLASDDFSVDAIREEVQRSSSQLPNRVRNRSKESLDFHLECLEPEESGSSSERISSCCLGSCTSLNSNSSSASLRSQEPPAFFNCPDTSFYCVSNGTDPSYPHTPPTLTNSEEGPLFLTDACDAVDFVCSSVNSNNSGSTGSSHKLIAEKVDELKGVPSGTSSRTTPVPIPSQSCDRRDSAKFDESWQFVSETGSIKDSPRGLPFNSPDSQDSNGSGRSLRRNGLHVRGGGGSSPRVAQRTSKDEKKVRRQMRVERLQMVRSTFYNAYSAAIGHRLKNGSDAKTASTGLSLLYQHFGVGGANGSRLTAHH